MYQILPYSYEQARKLGVKIRPSKKKFKKIDVYDKDDNFIASIGDSRYGDYATYIKKHGLSYANERRRLYRIRHAGEDKKKGTPGFFSWFILW